MEGDENVEGIMPTSLVSRASEVANLFRQAASLAGISTDLRNNLNDQHARFNIWLSSHELLSSPTDAGIPARREAVLLSLLNGLSRKLRAIPDPENCRSTVNTEQSSAILTDEEDDKDGVPRQNPPPDLGGILSRLYRFTMRTQHAMFLENPSNRRKSSRIPQTLVNSQSSLSEHKQYRVSLLQTYPSLAQHLSLQTRHIRASQQRRQIVLARLNESLEPQSSLSDEKILEDFAASYSALSEKAKVGQMHSQPEPKDIIPYVCLFSHCESEYTHFDSTEAWLSHMKEHSHDYTCQFSGHETTTFFTQEELIGHLQTEHYETIPVEMLLSIAALGKHPSEDVVKHLLSGWNAGVVEGYDRDTCVYCKKHLSDVLMELDLDEHLDDKSKHRLVQGHIMEHFKSHQEDIAVQSLSIFSDSEISDEKNKAIMAKNSPLKQPGTTSTPLVARHSSGRVVKPSTTKNDGPKHAQEHGYDAPKRYAHTRCVDCVVETILSAGGSIVAQYWYCCYCNGGPNSGSFDTSCPYC